MIDVKDFPEGTKINILYTAPITEYYGKKLPYSHVSSNSFKMDRSGVDIKTAPQNTNFYIDEIDFSEIEYLSFKCIISEYPSMISENLVLDLPKIKKINFSNIVVYNILQTITINCGDDFEGMSGCIEANGTTPIFTISSNSKKITQLNGIDAKSLSEIHINCDCEKLSAKPYKDTYSELKNITYHSGFPNSKYSQTSNYYDKMPNLTYESCISILNNLYDFVGHSVTPTSSQGKLKVHSNFLTLVGDEISIGTEKGWNLLV